VAWVCSGVFWYIYLWERHADGDPGFHPLVEIAILDAFVVERHDPRLLLTRAGGGPAAFAHPR
jgi:hypothetical protein